MRADLDYRHGVKFTAAVCDFCKLATRHRPTFLEIRSHRFLTKRISKKPVFVFITPRPFECSTDKMENEVVDLKSACEVLF